MTRGGLSIHIDRVMHVQGRTYIVPSSLPTPVPALHVGMTLSGVPIDPWLSEVPGSGESRLAFVISPHARPHALQAGQLVSLEDGRWTVSRMVREIRRVRDHEWRASVPKAIRVGGRIALSYGILAVSGLIWTFTSGVDAADVGGVSPSFFFIAAIVLYFVLAIVLGTMVGFLLPFVRDRDIAMLVGALAGSLALLSLVPLIALVDVEANSAIGIACAAIGGAVIGGWVAVGLWDDTQDHTPS